MSRLHSVLLRFVDGLKRVINHLPKHSVQELSRAEVHPQTGANLDLSSAIRVHYAGAEGQVHDAVALARLQEDINVFNGKAAFPNLPLVGSYSDIPAARNHHFINHQNLPPLVNSPLLNMQPNPFGVDGGKA